MVDNSLNLSGQPGDSKRHAGLFKHEKPQSGLSPVSEELESTINRLRVLEERYTNLQTELRVTEENMINKNKKLVTEIKALTLDITELRKEINEIRDKILLIIKEMQGYARKEDIKVLQKYIEMWEPMNFVTHQEVEDIIKEKLAEKR